MVEQLPVDALLHQVLPGCKQLIIQKRERRQVDSSNDHRAHGGGPHTYKHALQAISTVETRHLEHFITETSR